MANAQDQPTSVVEPLIQRVLLEERLFGRKYQAIALRKAYQRICCSVSGESRKQELVLITGVSGTGKTTLADDLKHYVTSREGCRGIFIQGKYDHLHQQNQAPFGGFVSAFTDYANQIMDEGEDIVHAIRELVRANKHVDRKLLVNMVPWLEDVLGESTVESLITEGGGGGTHVLSDSQRHRFRLTISEFVGVLSAHRPLVVFLDDLQWCDEDSLKLLEALAVRAHPGFMILGACRGNEVAISDPLSECLRSVEDSGVIVTEIRLACLDEPMVHELLSRSLQLKNEECAELARVVFCQTGGNFFYLTHFTNALQLDKILYRDEEGTWTWDGEKLQVLQTSSVQLMRKMMRRLPEDVQTVLKTAASIGAHFTLSVLVLLLPTVGVQSALITASKVAFVRVESTVGIYSFTHDQIQEAAYTLIPEDGRSAFHWELCQMLWKTKHRTAGESNVSLIVGQITKCVSEIKSESDREKAAVFLLKAGRQASSSSAFGTSLAYVQLGIDLLGKKRWHTHYDLCLTLHNVAGEVSYGVGDSDRLRGLTNSVFLYAKTYEDKLQAYSVKILSLGSAHRLQEAMELGLEVLGEVGEPIRRPSKIGALIEVWQVRKMLRKMSSCDILNLPCMKDPKKLVATRVINLLFIYAFFGRPEYTLPLAARLIKLTLRHGLSAMSSIGFSTFALILASFIPLIRDLDEAYNLAKLSLEILSKFSSSKKQWLPRVYVTTYGMVFPWREPSATCRNHLHQAYRIGMRTGDVEFGMLGAMLYAIASVFWGVPLYAVAQDVADFRKTAEAYRIDLVDLFLVNTQQLIANLAGSSEDVFTLTGEFMDEREARRSLSRKKNLAARLNLELTKGWLAVCLSNWELGELFHRGLVGAEEGFRSSVAMCNFHFQAAMISGALLRKYGRNRKRSRTFKRSFRQIQKMSKQCPNNFYVLQTILEAERSALVGRIDDAVNRYRLAVDISNKEGNLSFEGIATERLARTLDSDERTSNEARECFIKARTVFEAWGANAKVDQLNDIIANSDDVAASSRRV